MIVWMSDHARERMRERGITRQQVGNVLSRGRGYPQRGGRFLYRLGDMNVIISRAGVVVTAWCGVERGGGPQTKGRRR
ncbi:hypothetical protein GGQ74_001166 [Desulfobaculum xiamenense]|uniref:DUF4258 domain-containing protein n=1 Tax=Desulfobaculum xiamenense TaxID=995050 RepID=A0A846QFG2_9BACT|nr:DUF4258 domain-containing protein [Desulfobaculum xiamenense]NJB67526.1 hypothetical protein [Desulfobaculum xiamenense]